MAITLTLVGSATVDFLGSGYGLLEDFQPKQPNLGEKILYRVLNGDPTLENTLTIIESFRVRVTGANVAALATNINAIERLLLVEAGRRRATQQGQRVFMTYKPSGGATTFRSEVLSGRVELLPRSLAVWQWDALDTEIRVYIERRYYWEYNSEVQLTLSNGNGTDDTAGLAIFNNGDAVGSSPTKRHNHVEIDAAEAAGILPCPIRLAITNTYGTAMRRIYMAHKAQGTPASFVHILEAEDATLGTGVANAVDANASAGDVSNVTNVPAAERTLFTWTISATQAGYVLSQWIRPLLRFSTLPSNATINARFKLTDSTTGAVIAQTDYQLLSSADYLQALPTLELSPNLQGQAAPGEMKLILSAKDSAATGDFGLDFVQLSPVESGNGFRFLKPIDETLVSVPATTGLITDDGIDGAVRIESRQGIYRGFGGPLMLIPNALQRLYFLWDLSSAAAPGAATATIQAFIRPRKLTV